MIQGNIRLVYQPLLLSSDRLSPPLSLSLSLSLCAAIARDYVACHVISKSRKSLDRHVSRGLSSTTTAVTLAQLSLEGDKGAGRLSETVATDREWSREGSSRPLKTAITFNDRSRPCWRAESGKRKTKARRAEERVGKRGDEEEDEREGSLVL